MVSENELPIAVKCQSTPPLLIPSKQHSTHHNQVWMCLFFVLYLLVGTSVCFGWNALVNSISSIRSLFYGQITTFSEPITASYHTTVLIGAVISMVLGPKKLPILLVGLIGSGLASFLFIYLCCTLLNVQYAKWILSISSSLLGLFVSFALTSAFAFASTSALNSVAVSAGMGLAGLATFVIWLCLSRVVFNLDVDLPLSLVRLKHALAAITGAQAVTVVLSIVGVLILLGPRYVWRSVFQSRLRGSKLEAYSDDTSKATNETVEDDDLQVTNASLSLNRIEVIELPNHSDVKQQAFSSSWRTVCLSCFQSVLSLFVTVASSLYLFPNIWPLSWSLRPAVSDLIMGVFQAGDFLGRFLPVLFPPLSSNSIMLVAAIRLLIVIALFIVMSPFVVEASMQWIRLYLFNPWTESLFMFFLSLSNGFVATLCFVDATRCVQAPAAKSKASTLCLVSLLAGVAVGNTLSAFNPLASTGA